MMFLARRPLAVVVSTAAMMLWMTGGYPLGAQESSTAKSQSTKAKQARQADASASSPTDSSSAAKPAGKTAPPDVMHRVPPGYSKLGLTDQQREKLYKIQAEYYPKIHDLEKKADDLRARREKEFESVLTTSQKRLLAEAEQQKKAAAEAKKAAAVKAALKDKVGD